MRKILIISKSFYPVISPRSFRATELVKEFCRQGHDVTLLTVARGREQTDLAEEYGFKFIDLGPLRFKPVTIAKSGLRRLFSRILFRSTNLLLQYPDIELMWKVRNRLSAESGYDMLISIAVPHTIHWGVAWARSPEHPIATTWIADCGDPFMGEQTDTFRPAGYFKYLEKWFCKKTDFIAVPIVDAKKAYYPEFGDKIVVIPQGFRFLEISSEADIKNEVPTFAYAGSYIPGLRDPRPIISYLLNLEMDFKFHLYSKQNQMIRSLAAASNGRVILHDQIPRDKLLGELGKMDFLLNIENGDDRQSPSKLIDYGIVRRPILSVSSLKLDNEKFMRFLSGDYKDQYQIESLEKYRIENVSQAFVNCHDKHQFALHSK